MRRTPRERLVFLDESGVHLAMHRTHTWVKRGTEYVERVPMNWGRTLTLLGAMRLTGWVVLQTMFATTNADRFVTWLRRHLLPKLQRGDVLVMDNLRAHHDPVSGPSVAATAYACSTCRRTRRISIRSNRAGPCRSSTSASMPPVRQTICGVSRVVRGIVSRPSTVTDGLRMPVTNRLNSGDPWD